MHQGGEKAVASARARGGAYLNRSTCWTISSKFLAGYEFLDGQRNIVHIYTPIRHPRMKFLRLDPNRLQDFIAGIVAKRGARNPMTAEDPNRRYLEITGDD